MKSCVFQQNGKAIMFKEYYVKWNEPDIRRQIPFICEN
jgi:hypothetical protein